MTTEILRPDGVGDLTQLWSNEAGNNYLFVDEASQDGDTTYVYTSSPDRADLYALPSTGIGASDTINSVTLKAYIKRFDASDYKGLIGIKTESTEYWGDQISFGADYALATRVYSTNPDTGSAWTVTQLNALQIGAKSYVAQAGLKMT